MLKTTPLFCVFFLFFVSRVGSSCSDTLNVVENQELICKDLEGICESVCAPGFVPAQKTGKKSGYWVCDENDQWIPFIPNGSSQTPFVCEPVQCALRPNIEGSETTCDERDYLSECEVSCRLGWQNTGSTKSVETHVCAGDGMWYPKEDELLCSKKDCGAMLPAAELDPVAKFHCPETTFGSVCAAMCPSSFYSDSVMFACTQTGEWQLFEWLEPLNCLPVQCPPMIPDIPFGHSDCFDLSANSECEAHCEDGTLGSSTTFECSVSGKWILKDINQPLECVPKFCEESIPGIPFATSNCAGSNAEANSCWATCLAGYLPGGAFPFVCVANTQGGMSWAPLGSSEDLECVPKKCSDEIILPNAFGQCLGNNEFNGDSCSVSCNLGYTISSGETSYKCGEEAKWLPENSGSQLVCKRVECESNINGLTAFGSANCLQHLFGDLCTSTCDVGYVGDDSDYMCNADKRWEAVGSELNCVPRSCPSTITLTSGHASAHCSGDTVFNGDDCETKCVVGYVPSSGEAINKCSSDGEWEPINGEPDLFCTRISCGDSIPNLDVNAHHNCGETLYGDECITHCNTGYEGDNAKYLCNELGEYVPIDEEATCTKVVCPETIELEAGNAFGSCAANHLYEDTCNVSCDTGFEPSSGDALYQCSASGLWKPKNGDEFFCKRKDCGSLIVDANGQSDCGANTFYNNICRSSCLPGYDGGEVHWQCLEDATWSPIGGEELICVAKDCGSYVEHLDEKSINRECHGNTKFNGDACAVSCKTGFEKISGVNSYSCSVNEHWTVDISNGESDLVCKAVSCGESIQNLDVNAQYGCTSSLFGDSCKATCAPGYDGGSKVYQCSANRVWVSTDGESLSCTPKDCGSSIPDLALTGFENSCSGDTSFGGESCFPTCSPGYESETSVEYVCGDNGHWNTKIFGSPHQTCVKVNCGTSISYIDENLDLGTYSYKCTDTLFGSKCVVNCEPGYEGMPTSYWCSEDKTWTPTEEHAQCSPVDCGPMIPNLPYLSLNVTCEDTKYGGLDCLAQCDETKSAGEDAAYRCNHDAKWVPKDTALICGALDWYDWVTYYYPDNGPTFYQLFPFIVFCLLLCYGCYHERYKTSYGCKTCWNKVCGRCCSMPLVISETERENRWGKDKYVREDKNEPEIELELETQYSQRV